MYYVGELAIKTSAERRRNFYRAWSQIPDNRKEELMLIKNDQFEMSIYCDCSTVRGTRTVGISSCFVGNGRVIVESQTIERKNVGKNIFSELLAVMFALERLPYVLERYKKWKPLRITIYSDVHVIEDFIYRGVGKKPYMRELIAEINVLMESLPSDINVTVRYISGQKKHNIFYKASHNSARRAIGKR